MIVYLLTSVSPCRCLLRYNFIVPAISHSERNQSMKRLALLLCCGLLIVLTGCAVPNGNSPNTATGPEQKALDSITADGLMSHIKTLSSDEYEGRGPGTHGEDLSINYIANQFKQI